jgi:hypothetical protein
MSTRTLLTRTTGLGSVLTVEVVIYHQRDSWEPGPYQTRLEATLSPWADHPGRLNVDGLLLVESQTDLAWVKNMLLNAVGTPRVSKALQGLLAQVQSALAGHLGLLPQLTYETLRETMEYPLYGVRRGA